MDFQEFWSKITGELGNKKEFRTLDRQYVFDAVADTPDIITATPSSTGIARDIPKEQFQSMWDIMKNDIRSERYKSTKDRYSPFWSRVYVSALIDHIVADQDMT